MLDQFPSVLQRVPLVELVSLASETLEELVLSFSSCWSENTPKQKHCILDKQNTGKDFEQQQQYSSGMCRCEIQGKYDSVSDCSFHHSPRPEDCIPLQYVIQQFIFTFHFLFKFYSVISVCSIKHCDFVGSQCASLLCKQLIESITAISSELNTFLKHLLWNLIYLQKQNIKCLVVHRMMFSKG